MLRSVLGTLRTHTNPICSGLVVFYSPGCLRYEDCPRILGCPFSTAMCLQQDSILQHSLQRQPDFMIADMLVCSGDVVYAAICHHHGPMDTGV